MTKKKDLLSFLKVSFLGSSSGNVFHSCSDSNKEMNDVKRHKKTYIIFYLISKLKRAQEAKTVLLNLRFVRIPQECHRFNLKVVVR